MKPERVIRAIKIPIRCFKWPSSYESIWQLSSDIKVNAKFFLERACHDECRIVIICLHNISIFRSHWVKHHFVRNKETKWSKLRILQKKFCRREFFCFYFSLFRRRKHMNSFSNADFQKNISWGQLRTCHSPGTHIISTAPGPRFALLSAYFNFLALSLKPLKLTARGSD